MAVVNERMNRHEFDRRHAKRSDVVHDRLGAEAGIEASEVLVDLGVQFGEAFDVGLVDDGVVPRNAAQAIFAPPVEIGIDDDGLRHERSAVELIEGQIVPFGAEPIPEDGGVRHELAGVRTCVRVEQELVGVEAMANLGLVDPMHAEP